MEGFQKILLEELGLGQRKFVLYNDSQCHLSGQKSYFLLKIKHVKNKFHFIRELAD